jgi:hypothetical protein
LILVLLSFCYDFMVRFYIMLTVPENYISFCCKIKFFLS